MRLRYRDPQNLVHYDVVLSEVFTMEDRWHWSNVRTGLLLRREARAALARRRRRADG